VPAEVSAQSRYFLVKLYQELLSHGMTSSKGGFFGQQ
jgi:hypothetical protein